MSRLATFALLLLAVLVTLFAPLLFTVNGIFNNYGDVFLHYYPLKHHITERLITGRLPFWDPYIFAGHPVLANPQSALFYPLSLLFYLFPLAPAFNYFVVIHFFLAGMFFFLLISKAGRSRTAALAVSIAFCLSSFLVYRVIAGHPVAISGYIWLPLIMLLLDDVPGLALPWHQLILGLALAVQFLSGHTVPFAASMFYLVFHCTANRFSYARHLLPVFGTWFLLSALQFIPSLQLSRITETGGWPELVRSYSLPLRNLVNLFMPDYFGNPVDGTFIYPMNPSFFIERHSLYFGLIPVLLALSGLIESVRSKKYFYPLLAAVTMVAALGFYTPVYRLLYTVVPGLGYVRVPARFFYIALIALLMLASAGWDRYFKQAAGWLKISLVAIIAFDLLLWGHRFIEHRDLSDYRHPDAIGPAMDPMYRMITDPAAVNPNKAMLYHHFNVNGYEAVILKDFTRYLGLQEKRVLSPTGLARSDLFSPLAAGFSIRYRLMPDRASGRMTIVQTDNPIPRIYLARSVTVIPDSDVYDQLDYLRATKYRPDENILIGGRPPDFFKGRSGTGRLYSAEFTPERIEAELAISSPAAVVFSEIAFPGWKARAGGKDVPVYRANKVFRALILPAGEYRGSNRIILYFDAVSWRFGLYVTLLSLIILPLFLFRKKIAAAYRRYAGWTH